LNRFFLFLITLFIANQVQSEALESYGTLTLPSLATRVVYPGSAFVETDLVTKAKIKKHGVSGELEYGVVCVGVKEVIRIDRSKNYLGASVSYTLTNLDFEENPYFGQKYFNNLNLSLLGFSGHFCNWDWKARATVNMNLGHFCKSTYFNYDFLLWGSYRYTSAIGLHGGALIWTGMHINRIYPIFGFDWRINPSWKLNLIYPVNISATYTINCNWSVAVAGRYYFSRNRTESHHRFSRSLYFYRATGAEFAVNYDLNSRLKANLHAGYAFAGKLTLADKNYRHRETFSPKASPYVGCEVSLNF
jgi:hypothetical protein